MEPKKRAAGSNEYHSVLHVDYFMTPTRGKARCGCAYCTDVLIFVYSRVMLEPVRMIEPPSCINLYQFGLTYGLTFQEHAFGGLQPWLRPTVTISRSNES